MGTLGQKLDYLTDTKSILKQKINNLGGSLTDESTFRSYGDYLDELYNEMPKVTGEGTEITLTPTRKGKMNIGLKGNTSQASLPTGYTALDYIESTGTQYIDTGVATSNTIKVEAEVINTFGFTRNNRTYGGALFGGRLSSTNSNFSYVTGDMHDYVGTGNNFIEIDKNANTDLLKIQYDRSSINIYCGNYKYINNNLSIDIINSFNIYIFANNQNNTIGSYGTYKLYKFKIYDNDTLVRDFVPCKNENNEGGLFDLVSQTFFGNAGTGDFVAGNEVTIPNPDYPQDIHVVKGKNIIKIQSKNLFNKNDDIVIDKTLDDTDGSIIDSTGYWCTNYYIPVQPNTTYVASGNNNLMKAAYYDENKNFIYSDIIQTLTSTVSLSINPPSNCYYIRISNNGTPSKCQLEKGSTATDYVPYYYKDYPLNLGSLELCKIGDYQDYLYKEDGNWYKYGATDNFIFNGTETWRKSDVPGAVKTQRFSRDVTTAHIVNIGYCDKIKVKDEATSVYDDTELVQFSTTSDNKYIGIQINIDRLSSITVNAFKEWLTNNNLHIYRALMNPTSTQITDETLISQLDAIENAMSTTGTTTISQTNADLPFIISASALKPFTTETLTTSLTDGE